jgi:hypothetical protein
LENSSHGENRRSSTDWIGNALLLFAVVALVILNLLKSGILGGTQALPLGVQALFPLAFLFAGLSMLTFGVLLLAPRARRVLLRLSAGLAALSALSSVAYALVWWVFAPELMFWQDYACIGLQTVACGLSATAALRQAKQHSRLLLLACICVVLSTLAFLLPPLVEPAVSVLTRALALASPFALLVLSGLFVEDTTETTPAE